MLVNSNIDRPHNAVIDWTNKNILQAQITWSSNWLPFQSLSVFLYGSCFSNFSLRSVFCHHLFILLPFNFWPLHYLSLQLLSTHLVFSSVVHKDRDITLKGQMTEKTLKGKFAKILTGQITEIWKGQIPKILTGQITKILIRPITIKYLKSKWQKTLNWQMMTGQIIEILKVQCKKSNLICRAARLHIGICKIHTQK